MARYSRLIFSMKNSRLKVLEVWVKPSLLDLALGYLFQHGISTLEEKKQGKMILLTAELRGARKSILRDLQKLTFHQNPLFQKIQIVKIRNQKWAQNYKKTLRPFPLVYSSPPQKSRSILLWVDPRSQKPAQISPHTLWIEAGLAFGTGTHPTTRLCAQLLSENLLRPKVSGLLDLGCGTGLLAMVGSKLGIRKIWAVDNDPLALKVSEENFSKNKIQNIYLKADLKKVPKNFDVILANILLVTLLELKKEIVKRLKKKGILILSGLLYKDCPEMIKAYKKEGLHFLEQRNQKGWSALVFRN